MKLFILIFLVIAMHVSDEAIAQDQWHIANEATTRLKPAIFSQLPKNIVEYLEKRNCSVPQSFVDTTPHNVIRGQFARLGQFDWAVLCSRNRISTILVFWNGSTQSIAEIAKSKDSNFLQGIGDEKIGFSRMISAVNKRYLLVQVENYGGVKPPPSKHQGINDAFIEKASSVHYFYRQNWLELQGAD